jgi:hypothetical protein
MTSRSSSVLIAAILLGGVAPATGDPVCKPALTVQEVTFSPMRQQHRTWTARIAVDASRCATASGRFSIDFTRLKEDAPDLRFRQLFAWAPGQVEVTTMFAADEAVLDYSIEAVSCPCRD